MIPPYLPSMGSSDHSEIWEKHRQFQSIATQHPSIMNNERTPSLTPLMNYTPLPNYTTTEPRQPGYASWPQSTRSNSSDVAPTLDQREAILPGLIELRKDQRPWTSPTSANFHALRDRLIQQQWQLDREQQWRIEHEPRALGSLARLPLEVRCQIYRACFPTECLETDLTSPSERRPPAGLLSLMRTTRCIYDEVKPLIEGHALSRSFNLVLSNKGVRFERKQFNVDFLHEDFLQTMNSETFPPLGVFARTRNRMSNLRLSIQIHPIVPPPGLVPALEPFAMWVFSLLSRAEALQTLLVEFHLHPSFHVGTLANNDGTEMSISKLIGVLLSVRAATHCQTVMKQALTSEIRVVRFVVLQRSANDFQREHLITSFRWNRPVPQPVQTMTSSISSTIQDDKPRGTPEYSPPSPQAVQTGTLGATPESLPPRPPPLPQVDDGQRSEQAITTVERPDSPVYSPPPRFPAQAVDAVPLPTYSAPPPAQEALAAKSPSIGAEFIATAHRASLTPISANAEQDEALEVRPRSSGTPPLKTESSSTRKLREISNTRSYDDTITFGSNSDSSIDVLFSQTNKRHRKHTPVGQTRKRQKLDVKDEPQPSSASQTPRKSRARSRSASIEVAAGDEYVVQSLRDVRIKNGVPQIKVKWNGYVQMTWEPRAMLMEDVPEMVKEFDMRHWRPPEQKKSDNIKPKTEHKASQLRATESTTAPTEQPDTPRNATARLEQWKAQKQSLQSPMTAKASPPKSASDTQKRPSRPPMQLPPSTAPAIHPKYASDAPKRPLSAYSLYIQANRPHIVEDLGQQLGHQGLVKAVQVENEGTRRWLQLTPDQRAVWTRMHTKRVAVYHIQMEAFKAGKPVPSQEVARRMAESRIDQADLVDLT